MPGQRQLGGHGLGLAPYSDTAPAEGRGCAGACSLLCEAISLLLFAVPVASLPIAKANPEKPLSSLGGNLELLSSFPSP